MEALREASVIDLDSDNGDLCLMHPGASNDVVTCPIVEELLHVMIDRGRIEICSAKKGEGDVCMQSGDINLSKPKPLVIHFTRDITTQRPSGFQPSIAKAPVPFPYKSDKAVPWKYGVQGPNGRQDVSVIRVRNDIPFAKITNIFGTSGMTRSFVAPKLTTRSKDKGKAKADIGKRERADPTVNDEVLVGKIAEEGDDFRMREISAEEVTKFMRIIQ